MSTATNHTTIRYILFDLGFVLVELNGLPWFKEVYPELSDVDIHRRWVSLKSVKNFETGKITEAQFFAEAIKDLNLSEAAGKTFPDIYKAWVRGPYPQSEALLKKLKQHYRIGCLSNTNSYHIQHLNSMSSFLELLEHRFYSHEIGVMKPDAQAYKTVIAQLGIPAQDILFIDDSQDNVDAALQEGMQAFQAKGFEQVLHGLQVQLGFYL